jgi:hypothetical protein
MSAMLNLSRRSLIRGLFAAPAIVAAGNIMPVRLWEPVGYPWEGAAIHPEHGLCKIFYYKNGLVRYEPIDWHFSWPSA